jgi:hypothetical protein
MMPPMTSAGAASAMPAGFTLGQASTHLPQRVQASTISSTRIWTAASKERSADMGMDIGVCSGLFVARPSHGRLGRQA